MTIERQDAIEAMRRDFEHRLKECEAIQSQYLRMLDDPNVPQEAANLTWRALSNAMGELARDYPVTLVWRCRA